MKATVILEGDVKMIDFPIIVRDDNWIIPNGWYLLDNMIENGTIALFDNNRKPIVVIENVQISHHINDMNYMMSVIKTDKKLKIGDSLEY